MAESLSELSQLGLVPSKYSPSSDRSVRGPCPRCGGSRRLVVYLNGPFPRWYAKCDLCGFGGWAFEINPKLRNADIDANPPTLAAAPARDPAKMERLLSLLPPMVAEYHAAMEEENRQWWRSAGIPDDLQLFWELGFAKKRAIVGDQGQVLMVQAYSIPKHELGWKKVNVDFRLIGAPKECGKYRPLPGLPPSCFITRPDMTTLDNTGVAYVVEGSKKAMVTSIFLDNAQVVGVPSNTSWCGIHERLATAGRVYVILDPDSWTAARRLSRLIGPNARQVTLPGKIDDLILSKSLDRQRFERILGLSR